MKARFASQIGDQVNSTRAALVTTHNAGASNIMAVAAREAERLMDRAGQRRESLVDVVDVFGDRVVGRVVDVYYPKALSATHQGEWARAVEYARSMGVELNGSVFG